MVRGDLLCDFKPAKAGRQAQISINGLPTLHPRVHGAGTGSRVNRRLLSQGFLCSVGSCPRWSDIVYTSPGSLLAAQGAISAEAGRGKSQVY